MYEYKAIVVRVVDGDTVDVDIDLGFNTWLKKQRVRLVGIDAPETRTRDLEEKAAGMKTKEYVENFCSIGSEIILKTHKDSTGKFGRILGEIYKEGVELSLNQILLQEGLAEEYK